MHQAKINMSIILYFYIIKSYNIVRNRYLLFKTAENCYTQKLLSKEKKNPQPKMLMLTLKRVKEMFPDMEDIEYKIGGISE